MNKTVFADAGCGRATSNKALPEGYPANPIYLPAPHEVSEAFYTAFTDAAGSQRRRLVA